MKRLIIATLFGLATSVQADSYMNTDTANLNNGKYLANLDYNYYSGVGSSNGYEANGVGFSLGYDPLKWLRLSTRFEYDSISDTNIDVRTWEGSLTPSYMLSEDVGVSSKFGLGYNWNDSFNTSLGYIEPGVFFKLTDNAIFNVNYKYSGTINLPESIVTNGLVTGLEYSFNSRDSLSLQYEYANGDIGYSTARIGYMAHF